MSTLVIGWAIYYYYPAKHPHQLSLCMFTFKWSSPTTTFIITIAVTFYHLIVSKVQVLFPEPTNQSLRMAKHFTITNSINTSVLLGRLHKNLTVCQPYATKPFASTAQACSLNPNQKKNKLVFWIPVKHPNGAHFESLLFAVTTSRFYYIISKCIYKTTWRVLLVDSLRKEMTIPKSIILHKSDDKPQHPFCK